MRKRPIQMLVYFNEEEYAHLLSVAKKTNIPKSKLLRYLALGYVPPEAPPADYQYLVRQMRAIGNNLNQTLVIAKRNGILNVPDLRNEIKELKALEKEIRDVFRIKKADFK